MFGMIIVNLANAQKQKIHIRINKKILKFRR